MNNPSIHNLINGVAADFISVNDRSIHYGDGLFETILFHADKLYYWKQHYQRLQESCHKLRLKCPDEQLLLDDIKRLSVKNNFSDKTSAAIKIIISRGTGERGYRFKPAAVNENRIVSFTAINTEYSSLLSARLLTGTLCVCKQQLSINADLAGIKHLNRLENVLARNEWQETAAGHNSNHDIIDGLMLNANRHVIEGTMSNLFAVKNNQLFTPGLTLSGINGIMRNMIITLAANNNIALNQLDLGLDELLAMDEVFITNSLIGIKSVNKIEQSVIRANTVSQQLFNALLETKNDYAQTV